MLPGKMCARDVRVTCRSAVYKRLLHAGASGFAHPHVLEVDG